MVRSDSDRFGSGQDEKHTEQPTRIGKRNGSWVCHQPKTLALSAGFRGTKKTAVKASVKDVCPGVKIETITLFASF